MALSLVLMAGFGGCVMIVVIVFLGVVVIPMRLAAGIVMRLLLMMLVLQMHIELHPLDASFLFTTLVQVVTIQAKFRQFALQLLEINAQVEQRANEHVAADAAENVQIKCLHARFRFRHSPTY